MFRTRDFVLLFTTIVFLVAAIGATVFDQWRDGRTSNVAGEIESFEQVASTSDLILTARADVDGDINRTARINDMRTKIAGVEFVDELISEPDEVVDSSEATTTEVQDEEFESQNENIVLQCAGSGAYLGFWDPRGISVSSREGAVVAERAFETGPQVVLQLPSRTAPAATPSCLSSDVIGIANDGSLIRNDEMALYSIFGAETRVGYSLDGFPIHGMSNRRGDVCGGVVVGGQYRYELSAERTTLINCFAATPAQLP